MSQPQPQSEKPYKGEIIGWYRESFDVERNKAHYREDVGLGFIVRGTFVDHPKYGFSPRSSTSWIVNESKPDAEGNRMIETRNSRYKLLGLPLTDDIVSFE